MNSPTPQPQRRNEFSSVAFKRTRLRRLGCSVALLIGGIGSASVGHAQLAFNLTPTGNANADAGFAAAAARWSALFTDNVTININTGFAALGAGILAQAGSAEKNYSWASTRASLVADATSATDATAVANLQSAANGLALFINGTTNNPNGAASATGYLDNNNSANNGFVGMSNANAKALGLLAGNNAAVDATITFSSAFSWDFNPLDGIGAGLYDFIGIATHEIGHAMGFISNVDVLDYNFGLFSENVTYGAPLFETAFSASTLDLFRHSAAASAALPGAIDFTANRDVKYFSLDGGVTVGAQFATGVNKGDGRQASHWKDNLGLGILDPTAGTGELLSITSNDIIAFDAIGWNLRQATPAPDWSSTLLLLTMGLGSFAALRRRI